MKLKILASIIPITLFPTASIYGSILAESYKLCFSLLSLNKNQDKVAGGNYSLSYNLGQALANVLISNDQYSIAHNQLNLTSNTSKAAANDVHEAYAYPVPFKPSENHTHITFTNLTAKVDIYIYTISGELVRKLYKNCDAADEVRWDVKNDSGEEVFSGLYIYVIKNGKQVQEGKLVVIR
ncbi:T9SS type A sorting domain-containing protein [bacterium]